MAKIPRSSRRVLPSGAVPTAQVPQDIADTGQGLEARALGQIGEGIGEIGNVLLEIELRDRQASDLKQASTDAADRQSNKLSIEEWKNNNPLDEHTAENFGKVWDQNSQFDPSAYRDGNAQARAKILNGAERDSYVRTQTITAQDTRIRDTILSSEATYILEPNEGNRQNYENALILMHTGDRADTLLAAADARIAKNVQVAQIDNAAAAGFDAWRATVTDDNPDGDLNAGFDAITATDIPAGDMQEAESELKTRVTNRRAEDKRIRDEEAATQADGIFGDINNGNYVGIDARIDAAPALSEKEKVDLKRSARLDAEARLSDKLEDSPYNQFDPAVYQEMLGVVRSDPDSITDEDLRDLTHLGRESDGVAGGITSGQYKELSKMRTDNTKDRNGGTSVFARGSVVRAQSSINRMLTAALRVKVEEADEDKELAVRRNIEAVFQERQNSLAAFADANKDSPNFDKLIEEETKRLLIPIQEEATANWFNRLIGVSPDVFFNRRRATVTQTELPKPTTQAEFDAIPSGTDFIDTDGEVVTKK